MEKENKTAKEDQMKKIKVTSMDMNELRKKYWDLEKNGCTFEQFLDAMFEAREIGFLEARNLYFKAVEV